MENAIDRIALVEATYYADMTREIGAYLDAKRPLAITSAKLHRCNGVAFMQAWQTRQERASEWDGHRMTLEDYNIIYCRNRVSAYVPVKAALTYRDHLNT